MIGNEYTFTGITLKNGYAGSGNPGWAGFVDFFDAGFCSDNAATATISTEGTLRTRYFVRDAGDNIGIQVALEAVLAQIEKFDIKLSTIGGAIFLTEAGSDGDTKVKLSPAERKFIKAFGKEKNWTVYGI